MNGVDLSACLNSWILGVRVIRAGRNPLVISTSKYSEIRDSEAIQSWWPHMPEGSSYVAMSYSHECLMERVFGLELRHAPNVQLGTTGSVFRRCVFLYCDAQYHFAWAIDNLYESCIVDAQIGKPIFYAGKQGTGNVQLGSYGHGLFAQNGVANPAHSPGCGPRNFVYNSELLGTSSIINLSGAAENFRMLYSRGQFTLSYSPIAAVSIARVNFNHIFKKNQFFIPGTSPALNINANSIQCENQFVENEIYTYGTGSMLSGGSVANITGSVILPWQPNPVRSIPEPSIFAYQRTLPRVTLLSPNSTWTMGAVGYPVYISATATPRVSGRTITKIEFRVNRTKVHTDTTPNDGFSCVYTPTKPGTLEIFARAYDSAGFSDDVEWPFKLKVFQRTRVSSGN